MKTCSSALRTSDWVEGSPSNRTTTISTQPTQRRVAQSEPGLEPDRTSLERPENSCAATLPLQPDRAWEDLQRTMGETPQIQVCQACSVILKKTQCCNHCQRCFNKVLRKWSEFLCKCDISIFFCLQKHVIALSLWGIVCRLMRENNYLIHFRIRP
jgi:hypothetical protein